MHLKIIMLACLCQVVYGEATTPKVSDKARAEFWHSVSVLQGAEAAVSAANTRKAEAVAAMSKECGAWKLDQDKQTGEPICVEPPKPDKQ